MFENLELSAIQEENARKLVKIFLNQVEALSASLRNGRVAIQQLRDENNRLKGEQGKPKVKASIVKPVAEKHSSEKERRQPRGRHKKGGESQFAPGLKAIIPAWHFGGGMNEPKALELLGSVGIQISPAQISNLLIHRQTEFHAASDAMFAAGLKSSPPQMLPYTWKASSMRCVPRAPAMANSTNASARHRPRRRHCYWC